LGGSFRGEDQGRISLSLMVSDGGNKDCKNGAGDGHRKDRGRGGRDPSYQTIPDWILRGKLERARTEIKGKGSSGDKEEGGRSARGKREKSNKKKGADLNYLGKENSKEKKLYKGEKMEKEGENDIQQKGGATKSEFFTFKALHTQDDLKDRKAQRPEGQGDWWPNEVRGRTPIGGSFLIPGGAGKGGGAELGEEGQGKKKPKKKKSTVIESFLELGLQGGEATEKLESEKK